MATKKKGEFTTEKISLEDKIVTVTGGAGFLGKYVTEELQKLKPRKIVVPRSVDFDLRNKDACLEALKGSNFVIHLAAKVGGIGYNQAHPADLFDDNLLIGYNTMQAALELGIQKFVAIGTICSYPKITNIPFQEEDLWNGFPEETNAPYGLAKKMLIVQSQAYAKQYGFRSINLLPVNLYGPRDNFNPESSHVIPALIKKFVEAHGVDAKKVVVWGTGLATREFLYVEDAAKGIILATQNYDSIEPINLGSGMEISIYHLAHLIAEEVGYKGEIIWDTSKPDGQPRRMLDTSKAEKEFGFKATVPFEVGIQKTVAWYKANK